MASVKALTFKGMYGILNPSPELKARVESTQAAFNGQFGPTCRVSQNSGLLKPFLRQVPDHQKGLIVLGGQLPIKAFLLTNDDVDAFLSNTQETQSSAQSTESDDDLAKRLADINKSLSVHNTLRQLIINRKGKCDGLFLPLQLNPFSRQSFYWRPPNVALNQNRQDLRLIPGVRAWFQRTFETIKRSFSTQRQDNEHNPVSMKPVQITN